MSNDNAGNRRNVVPALKLGNHELKWYRLDDGVMGGQSATDHKPTLSISKTESKYCSTHDPMGDSKPDQESSKFKKPVLHFQGTINTNGGGFCSVRAEFPPGLFPSSSPELGAVKIRYRGDGKTYKVLLSDGSRGGPMSKNPTWQIDLPTQNLCSSSASNKHKGINIITEWEEAILPLNQFLPSIGGRTMDPNAQYEFNPSKMKEIGLMLSLKLSNGQPNPPKTFGTGIFPFSLYVHSIEFLKDHKPKQLRIPPK